MALVKMCELLWHAQKNGYAVGYFEAFNMDAMLAVLHAAENKHSPVIIGFGGQFLGSPKRYIKEDVYLYGAVAREAARRTSVPAAVLLNEADIEDMVYQGMQAGFNAVMYQKAGEPAGDTIRITKSICEIAHMLGIDVESEVGELPCADISTGAITRGEKTSIDEAKRFSKETGIDALAVAVGNIHLLEGKKAPIDLELIKDLREAIPVPLVLHGGTGIAPSDIQEAIHAGICKINVGTALKRSYIESIGRLYEGKNLSRTDPHATIGWGGVDDMTDSGKAAIAMKTEELMDLFGSSGQAGLR